MKSLTIYSSVLIFLIAVHPGWTKVIYVNHAATGENNGSSWADAYVDLQDALAAAEADDEIWVATGRYIPGTTRQSTFQLKENVALYGGFLGTESERDQRDWVTNTTVLSGDINGDDSVDFSNTEENVYHVVTGASNAILDGFTVAGGNANGDDPNNGGGGMFNVSTALSTINCTFTKNQAKFGGGMLNIESSPFLANCAFTDNSAEKEGGAIHNFASSSPSLTSCIIKTNVAEFGGGMMNNSASPTVVNCLFEDNTAKGDGGGIYNFSSSLLKLSFCTLRSNTAPFGGGVMNNASSPTITNCLFVANSVENWGGGMINASSSPDIENCRFIENSADTLGGAMLNFQSTAKISNCSFTRNSTDEDGGAMVNLTSSPVISNCIFSENFAGRRGGSLLNHTSAFPNVINCTFSRNIAKTGSTAVDNRIRSFPIIRNSIFWDDRPELASPPIVSDIDSGATVTYSCVQFGYFGLGNTQLNPRFINSSDIDGPDGVFGTKDDGLNLQTNSPCINAGTRKKAPAKDISGLSRPQGNFFDMGSYEVELSPDQRYTLSGNVQYSGSQTGPIVLQVQHSIRLDENPNAKLVLPNEGTTEFEFSSIDAGTYYVLAYVDLDGDGQYDFPEPRSVINEAVSLLNSVTDLSVTIVDISPIVYVNQQAGGANNGTSWDDAFIELSDALTYRVFGQRQIWVAQGTYTPTSDGDRFKSFRIPEGVALYGGFLGNESGSEHRNWLDHPTILSGDLNGDDGPNFANNDDNVYHVVMGANRIRLDGFIISGGNADGGSHASHRGGGMYSGFSSSSTVANCTFRNNSAWLGGGMYTTESTTKINNCSFTQNFAEISGGGMCNERSSPVLTKCKFLQNDAEIEGGGVYNDHSEPSITDCMIHNNRANSGGGMSNWESSPKLFDCDFVENSAEENGGGMDNLYSSPSVAKVRFQNNVAKKDGGGLSSGLSDLQLTTCQFIDNSANESGGGIAFLLSTKTSVILDCIFEGNIANKFGGGIDSTVVTYSLSNCKFLANQAKDGGGVSNDRSSPTISNCEFVENIAGQGGGLFNQFSSPIVTNCAFRMNSARSGGGVINDSESNATVIGCDFISNSATDDGGGMYSLRDSSPETRRCTFDGNSAQSGAGLFLVSSSSISIIADCVFMNNAASTAGGGVASLDAFPDVTNSTFMKNVAMNGGGLYARKSEIRTEHCSFSENSAISLGGGVYLDSVTSKSFVEDCAIRNNDAATGGGIVFNATSSRLSNCTIANNRAEVGGGIRVAQESPSVIRCVIRGNSAEREGGGVKISGASPIVKDCFLIENSARLGGGVQNSNSSPDFINCILYANATMDPDVGPRIGGGIHNQQSSPNITNCSFIRNLANDESSGLSNEFDSNPVVRNSIFWEDRPEFSGFQIINFINSEATVSNSCVQFGFLGIGNIGLDPRFADPSDVDGPDDQLGTADDGLHVLPGSPVIGTGSSDKAPETDILGLSRPQGDFVDMGAYEFPFSDNQIFSIRGEVQYSGTREGPIVIEIYQNFELFGNFTSRLVLESGVGLFSLTDLLSGTYYVLAFLDVNGDGTYQFPEPRRIDNAPITLIADIDDFVIALVDVTPIVYVDSSATGAGDGTSWSDAFSELSDALSRVLNEQEIWVAGGTYKPTQSHDRFQSFQMRNGVAVYGGFAGNELARAERDIGENPTVLSGDLRNDDNGEQASLSDNVYHVVVGAENGTLDGFVVTGGNADGVGITEKGGGMLNDHISVTVANCVFINNSANFGAAMWNSSTDTHITNSVFYNNTDNDGDGGVMFNEDSALTVANCTFVRNLAGNEGAAITNLGSTPFIINSIFWEDRTEHWGSQIRFNDLSKVNVSFSCIQFGFGGEGNIATDPMFVNAADAAGADARFGTSDDGLMVLLGSPCINSAASEQSPNQDFAGVARPQAGFADMGAYELPFFPSLEFSLSGDLLYTGSNSGVIRIHLYRDSRLINLPIAEIRLAPDELSFFFEALFAGTYYLLAFVDVDGNGAYQPPEPRNSVTDPIHLTEDMNIMVKITDGSSVIFVDVEAEGKNNGTGWLDAFNDLSEAIRSAVSGQQIWVAEGTYTPLPADSRFSTFQLKSGVEIYGGFSGTESAIGEREMSGPGAASYFVHEAVLSGDFNGDDGENFVDYDDNVFHVITGADNAILDGLIVRGGNANGAGLNNRGGGLLNIGTSPSIIRCYFLENRATQDGGAVFNIWSNVSILNCTVAKNQVDGGEGGGLYYAFSNSTLTNSRISENHAERGGGISNLESNINLSKCILDGNHAVNSGGAIDSVFSELTVTDTTIVGNSADLLAGGGISSIDAKLNISRTRFALNFADLGGGIFNSNLRDDSAITECIFHENTARFSGGGLISSRSSPRISESVFSSNTSREMGGALSNFSLSNPSIIDCSFFRNSSAFAGAMSNFSSSPSINRCTLRLNSADDFGGAMANSSSSPQIANTLFQKNSAPSGGAVYDSESVVTIVNCTFQENRAVTDGQALNSTSGSMAKVTNSIFWDSEPSIASEALIIESFLSTVQIQASNVRGLDVGNEDFVFNTDFGDDLGGNIDQDPLLSLDGHLLLGSSPCVDSGVNDSIIPEEDMDQELRPDPASMKSDIGSDEFTDTDRDGIPDWLEMKVTGTQHELAPDSDPDHDGLESLEEYSRSTNPSNPDSDFDGIRDGEELSRGMDPLHPDTVFSPFTTNSKYVAIERDEIAFQFLYATLEDMDDDADLDLVYSLSDGTLWYLENNGSIVNAAWDSPTQIAADVFSPFTTGDLNGDGYQEIIILSNSDLAVIENIDGQGWKEPIHVGLKTPISSGNSPKSLDIDQDGDLDIVLTNFIGELSLIENKGDSNIAVWSAMDTSWAGDTKSTRLFETLGDIDLDGDLDRLVGFNQDGIPAFDINVDEHLIILPRYLTMVQGETQQLEVAGDPGKMTFSLVQNTSGGSISNTGLYTAGLQDISVDIIRVVSENGLSGLVVVNVISPDEADRNAKVLIVVGTRSAEDSLFSTSERLAMDAYVVCRQRGYRTSDICFLTPNGTLSKSVHLGFPIDAEGDNGELETAIKDWASDGDDLILYFVDHGVVREGLGNLVLRPGEYLTSETLKAWLDDWQTQKTERTSLVIIDTCYSGHFVEELAFGSPQRIVMAASEPGALAHFQGNGSISFSQLFWDETAAGAATHEAFQITVNNLTETLDQVPLIDTNGDGVEEDIDGIEMVRSIGLADLLGGIQRPAVGTVMDDVTIDKSTATLWCRDVVSNNGILKVITYIVPPTLQTEVEGGSALTDMDNLELIDYVARRRIDKSDFESWQNLPEQLFASRSLTLSEENKDLLLSSYTEIEGIYVLNDDVPASDLQRLRTIEERLGYPPRYEADWEEFDTPGLYRVLFFAEDNWGMLSTVRSAQITIEGPGKKAMIIECHGITDVGTPWSSDEIGKQAQLVRQTLHNRSFTAEDIQWFGPAHQAVNKATIADVLISDFVEDIDELTLYWVGNATTEGVLLSDDDMLTPLELKGWLDILQGNSTCRVTVVVETDYSGRFLAGVANPDYERYVVTSTDSVNQTLRSSGLTFGNWFWGEIRRGRSIQQAFTRSKAIARASQIQPIPFSLDDDGNGTYEKKKDGLRTSNKFIGTLFLTGDDEVQIGSVSESLVLEPGDSGFLFVKDAFSPDGAELRVTATLIQAATGEIMTDDVLIMANAGSGHYQRDIHYDDFPEPGRYVAIIQVASLNDSTLSAIPVPVDIFVGIAPPENNGVVEDTYPRLVVDDDATAAELDDSGQDIYRLWAVVSQAITIELENVSEGADVRLAILAGPQETDTPLEEADDAPAGSGELIFSWNPLDTGWYYVQVEAITVNEVPISYSIGATSEHFGADGYEEDDIPEMAKWISWQDGDFQEHNFHDEGDEDWLFYYALKKPSYEIKVSEEGVNCDVILELYKEVDGDFSLLQNVDQTQGNGEIMSQTGDQTPGRYYVRIRNANPQVHGVGTGYRIEINDTSGFIPGILMVLIHDNFLNEQLLTGTVSAAGLDPFNEEDKIYILDKVPAGTHEVTVSVTGYQPNPVSKSVDVQANDLTEAHFNLTPISLSDRTVSLKKGWNMTSLPFIPRDNRVETVFQDCVLSGEVWSWKDGRLQLAPRLKPMTGYWVYCHAQQEPLSIQGMDVIDTAKTLSKGWNLFGATSNTPLPETIEGPIWYWDNGIFKQAQTLEAGYGYWIYIDEPVTIDFNAVPETD